MAEREPTRVDFLRKSIFDNLNNYHVSLRYVAETVETSDNSASIQWHRDRLAYLTPLLFDNYQKVEIKE